MAKRNQYNKATLSTITTLSCSYVTGTAVSASAVTCSFISASSQINGRLNCGTSNFFVTGTGNTITIPVNTNYVVVAANAVGVTCSINWQGFNYAQPYRIMNPGSAAMKISGALSASGGAVQWGAVGIDNLYVNSTPANEFLIPAGIWVDGVGYPSGTANVDVKGTYVVYASGAMPRIPIAP
tara:strand:- start:2825 stop:3370 length:546 start_codon:yes stop_codon:yes gene_type:complete